MTKNPRRIAFIAGASGTVFFVLFSLIKLGLVPTFLFFFFAGLAFQDSIKGRIPLLAFLPTMLLPVYYWGPTRSIFFNLFIVMLTIWLLIRIMQSPLGRGAWAAGPLLDPEKNYLGFGDVLGLPLAVTLAQIYVPFWGLAIFAGVLALIMPLFLRRQNRRFLPLLLPPLATVFIVAVII